MRVTRGSTRALEAAIAASLAEEEEKKKKNNNKIDKEDNNASEVSKLQEEDGRDDSRRKGRKSVSTASSRKRKRIKDAGEDEEDNEDEIEEAQNDNEVNVEKEDTNRRSRRRGINKKEEGDANVDTAEESQKKRQKQQKQKGRDKKASSLEESNEQNGDEVCNSSPQNVSSSQTPPVLSFKRSSTKVKTKETEEGRKDDEYIEPQKNTTMNLTAQNERSDSQGSYTMDKGQTKKRVKANRGVDKQKNDIQNGPSGNRAGAVNTSSTYTFPPENNDDNNSNNNNNNNTTTSNNSHNSNNTSLLKLPHGKDEGGYHPFTTNEQQPTSVYNENTPGGLPFGGFGMKREKERKGGVHQIRSVRLKNLREQLQGDIDRCKILKDYRMSFSDSSRIMLRDSSLFQNVIGEDFKIKNPNTGLYLPDAKVDYLARDIQVEHNLGEGEVEKKKDDRNSYLKDNKNEITLQPEWWGVDVDR